jgi:hypothetical protein
MKSMDRFWTFVATELWLTVPVVIFGGAILVAFVLTWCAQWGARLKELEDRVGTSPAGPPDRNLDELLVLHADYMQKCVWAEREKRRQQAYVRLALHIVKERDS